MPAFHFQLDGDPDAEAIELSDLAGAKCEALHFAARHICEAANAFWDRVEWTLSVSDEKRLTLFALRIVGTESAATSLKASRPQA
jgi:hypothetical protein